MADLGNAAHPNGNTGLVDTWAEDPPSAVSLTATGRPSDVQESGGGEHVFVGVG